MRHVNHEASKAIVVGAQNVDASTLVMEDLTHIRKRIKGGQRVGSRVHRWAWRELQNFMSYKQYMMMAKDDNCLQHGLGSPLWMPLIIAVSWLLFPIMVMSADNSQTPALFGRIERLDPRFDALVPKDAKLEVIAEGFNWLEGPVWRKDDGYLLFSDIPANTIYAWNEQQGVSSFLKPSGYTGKEPFTGREPGANGLTFDSQGRLTLCQHGDRRIIRLEPNGSQTVLIEHYRDQRLNSPNDLVYHSNGDLYFTDPPFGLPDTFNDPNRELPFSGVYRLAEDGTVTLLEDDLKAPNGIAFSPDEKILYLTDVDRERPRWLAYPVLPDGALGQGSVLFDASRWQGERKGAPDGIKVDVHGYIYGAGPGGVYVFAPDGTHLGTLFTGVPTGNLTWGEDGSVLYIAADTQMLRIALHTKGIGF